MAVTAFFGKTAWARKAMGLDCSLLYVIIKKWDNITLHIIKFKLQKYENACNNTENKNKKENIFIYIYTYIHIHTYIERDKSRYMVACVSYNAKHLLRTTQTKYQFKLVHPIAFVVVVFPTRHWISFFKFWIRERCC